VCVLFYESTAGTRSFGLLILLLLLLKSTELITEAAGDKSPPTPFPAVKGDWLFVAGN